MSVVQVGPSARYNVAHKLINKLYIFEKSSTTRGNTPHSTSTLKLYKQKKQLLVNSKISSQILVLFFSTSAHWLSGSLQSRSVLGFIKYSLPVNPHWSKNAVHPKISIKYHEFYIRQVN